MSSLKHKYVECACSSSEHTIRFTYFEDDQEIYIETQLKKGPWYKRLYIGLLYILGRESKYGHWEETMLDSSKIRELHNFLHETKAVNEYFLQ